MVWPVTSEMQMPPHKAFIARVGQSARTNLVNFKRMFKGSKLSKKIGQFLRRSNTERVETLVKMGETLSDLKQQIDQHHQQLKEYLAQMEQLKEKEEQALKDIEVAKAKLEEIEGQANELEFFISSKQECIKKMEKAHGAMVDKIELLEQISEKIDNGSLFHFAGKTRAEIRKTLGLETEEHLRSLDEQTKDKLISALQVAGMEYHEDIVNEGITIPTGHVGGRNLLKQLATILGIPLSLETQEQEETIKRVAEELANGDDDGEEEDCKPPSKKQRI